MFVLNIFCGWGGYFPRIVAYWFYQCSANDRTPCIQPRKSFGMLVVYLPDLLCVATLPSLFSIVSHFALQPVVRQSPRYTPCFVVNWLSADVSLWPFCVSRMYRKFADLFAWHAVCHNKYLYGKSCYEQHCAWKHNDCRMVVLSA
jgi:hypothetical protein